MKEKKNIHENQKTKKKKEEKNLFQRRGITSYNCC